MESASVNQLMPVSINVPKFLPILSRKKYRKISHTRTLPDFFSRKINEKRHLSFGVFNANFSDSAKRTVA
jgi:hypothetical protein